MEIDSDRSGGVIDTVANRIRWNAWGIWMGGDKKSIRGRSELLPIACYRVFAKYRVRQIAFTLFHPSCHLPSTLSGFLFSISEIYSLGLQYRFGLRHSAGLPFLDNVDCPDPAQMGLDMARILDGDRVLG